MIHVYRRLKNNENRVNTMINTKEEFLKFEPCLWLPAGGCPWIPTHKTTSSTNLLVHRILEPWNWPLLENMSSLAATPGSRTVVVDKGYSPGEIFSFMAGFKSRTASVYILLIINLSISIHRPQNSLLYLESSVKI